MTETTSTPENDLQFDKADYDDSQPDGMICDACKSNINKTYFNINGVSVCPACCSNIQTELASGSGTGRFLKALLFGIPAAALGAGIYYGISAATGYEFGLVAIVIGLMVGAAVRAGAKRRGGWLYQTIAVVLTYMAIASTYIPYIIQGIREADNVENVEITQPVDSSGQPVAENSAALSEETPAETPSAVQENQEELILTSPAEEEPVSLVVFIIAYATLFAFAMAAPFLAGFENIIGLIIIFIGLYEAWKLNKHTEIIVTGPFNLTPDTPASDTDTVNE